MKHQAKERAKTVATEGNTERPKTPTAIIGAVAAGYQYQWEPTAGLLAKSPDDKQTLPEALNLFPKAIG
jgi:hypothetical protein